MAEIADKESVQATEEIRNDETKAATEVDTSGNDSRIAELEAQIASLNEQKEEIKAESIKRRFDLKEVKADRDSLEERLAALEAENRDAKLKAALVEATSKHGLPAEARELLGTNPDEVDSRAESLAALLGAKKKEEVVEVSKLDGAVKRTQSVVERQPSGGRMPQRRNGSSVAELRARFR